MGKKRSQTRILKQQERRYLWEGNRTPGIGASTLKDFMRKAPQGKVTNQLLKAGEKSNFEVFTAQLWGPG